MPTADAKPGTNDTYVVFLAVVLAGYALLGKGFAYIGYPPLLVGEVALALGLVAILRSRCWLVMLATVPSLMLVLLIGLISCEVILGYPAHGMDAARDGVIGIYGLYALTVIALLLERPERLEWIIGAYSGFAFLIGIIGGSLTYITAYLADAMPVWPVSGVTIIYVRLGECAIHLAGAATFVILGLRQVTWPWVAALCVGLLVITPSRGGMLSALIPIAMATVVAGQIRRIVPVVLALSVVFAISYATGLTIPLSGGRSLGAEQILENFGSLTGNSNAANLDGTKEWRLRWWKEIRNYTFDGPYFWTGKGYGMSLAESDGFVVGREFVGTPLLRSPHNAHMTMLARSGVPGFLLWVGLGLTWYWYMMVNFLQARRRGHDRTSRIFFWIVCYVTAIVIDASFDVALEGPMVGIWFWSLLGLGIGSGMIYRWSAGSQLRASNSAAFASSNRFNTEIPSGN